MHRPSGSSNTGVIAASGALSVKGRDSGQFGITSGAKANMSSQITTGTVSVKTRRNAAKTVLALSALVLTAMFALSPIGTAAGDTNADHAPLQALFGTVVEVDLPDTLAVATDSGVVEVIVPDTAEFTGDVMAVEDISEGDRIVASIHVNPDDSVEAVRVLVVPNLSTTVTRHILGVIVDHEDGVVVVQDRDGNSVSIDVPQSVEVPEVGTVVTAIAQLDRDTGRLLAQTFDLVEDAVQRLQEALDRATDEDQIEALEELLERARDQHLSALDRARDALERAQNAVQAAIQEREEAERRLAEVEARFEDLRQRYVQEASDRNERLPQLRTEGVISFDAEVWLDASGTFTLRPRINDADDSVTRTIAWNENTLAIVPVELREADPDAPAVTATTARSVALPLNDVKSLIPSGSSVIVQYDPNTDPALATLITVIPPEIPDAIKDALERERLRSISGFITLVEETQILNAATGVIVITNREHDVKVAVKVTEETQIEVDGRLATLGDLAAGMAVDVDFAEVAVDDDAQFATQSSLSGRLDALRIRARSTIDSNEVNVAGVIAGLDVGTQTLAVLTSDGSILKANIVSEAEIVKDGKTARFGALETGDLVLGSTLFNRETQTFTRIVAQSPRAIDFVGTITGFDRNPDRLTITTTNGDVLIVFITSSTLLLNEDGERLEASDLAAGHRIIKGRVQPVQLDDRTVLVASELVIGAPAVSTARGVVSRIDADSGALRITPSTASGVDSEQHLDLSVAENNRSILFKNETRIRTLEPVEVGDIVESVSFTTSNGVIVRMSVVSPKVQRTRGEVDAVATESVVIDTRAGRTIRLAVVDETVITLNGRRVDSLESVSTGDTVASALYIASEDSAARGIAVRLNVLSLNIEVVSPGGPGEGGAGVAVETSISGVIEEITGETWTIGDRVFRVNSDTRLFGERPEIGLVAKATLVLNSDGRFVAASISVAGRPDINPSTRPAEVLPALPSDGADELGLVRILGKVQAVEESDSGNVVVVVDGVKVLLIESTIVLGDPKVGASALAVVRRSPAGNVTAVTMIFTNRDGSVIGPVDEQPGVPPSVFPTPEPADPEVVSPEDENSEVTRPDDSVDQDADNVVTVTIVVEEVSGRVVIAEGRTYFLTVEQVANLGEGDSITVDVQEVGADELADVLPEEDLATLTENPLYEAATATGSNPIFVAE